MSQKQSSDRDRSLRVPIAFRPVIFTPELQKFDEKARDKHVTTRPDKLRVNIVELSEMQSLSNIGGTALGAINDEWRKRVPESFNQGFPVSVSGVGTYFGRRSNFLTLLVEDERLKQERAAMLEVVEEVVGEIPEAFDKFVWNAVAGNLNTA